MKFVAILALVLAIVGCTGNGDSVQLENSAGGYDVKYLFTVEGVRVFRFYDGFAPHYLAVGDGEMLNSTVGKSKSSSGHDDAVIKAKVKQ